jgi:hypothetical protein
MHDIGSGRYPYTPLALMMPRAYIGMGLFFVFMSAVAVYMNAGHHIATVTFLYSIICFVLGGASQVYHYAVADAKESGEDLE